MKVYDNTIRELFKEIPETLIKLLTGKKAVKFLDVTFQKVKEREVDLLVELEDKEIFHLEIQSVNDSKMPFRMLEYYLLITQKFKEPTQMVLYVGNEKCKINNKICNKYLKYEFFVKDIREIDCSVLMESKKIEDNILAILCNIKDANEFFRKINKKLLNLNNKKREDYIRKLINLSRLRPQIFKFLETTYKEQKMPIILEPKSDPLYQKGWEEAWDEAWREASREARIRDAVIMIKKFNLPVETVAKELGIDIKILKEKLKEEND